MPSPDRHYGGGNIFSSLEYKWKKRLQWRYGRFYPLWIVFMRRRGWNAHRFQVLFSFVEADQINIRWFHCFICFNIRILLSAVTTSLYKWFLYSNIHTHRASEGGLGFSNLPRRVGCRWPRSPQPSSLCIFSSWHLWFFPSIYGLRPQYLSNGPREFLGSGMKRFIVVKIETATRKWVKRMKL